MLSRRQLLGGLLMSGMSGCTMDPTSTVSLFRTSIFSKGKSDNDYPLTAEQIHQIPYATLGVRVDRNPRAVIVLATVEGRTLHWVSADRVSFVTRDGMLIQTRGLQRDLVATRWLLQSQDDPLWDVVQKGLLPPRGIYREIDLGHADEHGIAIESQFEVVKEETIRILDREHETRRIDETVVVKAWRWEFRNSFWMDSKTGRVLRSVQQYCPEMPPIEFEVLKPA